MPIPKTYAEREQLAHAAADRAEARWRQQTVAEREGIGIEEVRHDAYVREAILLEMIMDGSIERIAEGLIEHCRQIGNRKTLASVVAAVLKAAEQRFGNKPETSLEEIIDGLVEIFGADAVRATIKEQ